MSLDEYYRLLQKKYAKTDWTDKEQVKAYNEYAHKLRKMLYEDN